jgi:hypothetical protein
VPEENPTPDELRAMGVTEEEIGKIAEIKRSGVPWPSRREVVHLEPVSDPLIAFFWARLDETQEDLLAAKADAYGGASGAALRVVESGESRQAVVRRLEAIQRDVAAKKAVLDDYARRCADLDNPAREMECQLIRDVIKRLATVYAGHPDYTEDFRP